VEVSQERCYATHLLADGAGIGKDGLGLISIDEFGHRRYPVLPPESLSKTHRQLHGLGISQL
jgi:hypothetical protein